jgi:hypothetical protein
MKFYADVTGENFVLQIDKREATLLHGITEFIQRCHNKDFLKDRISTEEVELSSNIADDIEDYLSFWDIVE